MSCDPETLRLIYWNRSSSQWNTCVENPNHKPYGDLSLDILLPRGSLSCSLLFASWAQQIVHIFHSRLVLTNQAACLQKRIHRTRFDPFKGKMPQITRRYDKRDKMSKKQHCILIHCESSPREQRNMFCVRHGDSFTFFRLLCFFLSLLFSVSLPPSVSLPVFLGKHFMPEHLLIVIHTSLPSSWPELHKP